MLGDLSLTPFILLAQVGAWVWIVRRARLKAGISDEVERDAVALACLLLIWAAGLSAAALAGLLRLPAVAGLAPVLWLGLVPYVLVALSLWVLPTLRIQSLRLLDRTPAWLLTMMQALRLLALASLWPLYAQLGGAGLWRALNTEPLPFALAGLDLLYGLSALPVAVLVAKQRMGPRSQVAWLVLGALLLLVPRLGPMDQSLGLAFSYFYLPLDPQGLLGYPQVLNYGLIGPGFVLLALWQGLWLLRRDLASHTLPLGAQPRDAASNARGLTAGLARLGAPVQALAQRRRQTAAQRAEQRAQRSEAQRQAREERAQQRAQKQAQKQAGKRSRAQADPLAAPTIPAAETPFDSSIAPPQPPALPQQANEPAPPPALTASDVPPLLPEDLSGDHAHQAAAKPGDKAHSKPGKRPWFLGRAKPKPSQPKPSQPKPSKPEPPTGEPSPEGAAASPSDADQSATAHPASNPSFGAPPPPLPGHEDLDFDTSPFQIEPLPERAWSKAHDLDAEPDIPFADPLVPTNVAPLPSEVPPPAPPPLDPVFQSPQSGSQTPDSGQQPQDRAQDEPQQGSEPAPGARDSDQRQR